MQFYSVNIKIAFIILDDLLLNIYTSYNMSDTFFEIITVLRAEIVAHI